MTNKPTVMMLIGVPGSGKSTWVDKFLSTHSSDSWHVYSTDTWIEQVAAEEGKTYNDVFKDVIGPATSLANSMLGLVINNGLNVVWDQTNISRKSRAAKLAKFGSKYEKVAVYFPTPRDIEARLASRPGKIIPDNIIESMISGLEVPTFDEGYERIITILPHGGEMIEFNSNINISE